MGMYGGRADTGIDLAWALRDASFRAAPNIRNPFANDWHLHYFEKADRASKRRREVALMIICSCNVLSDHQIRAVLRNNSPRITSQVYNCLGCSAQCGRCVRTIRRIMDQAMVRCSGECACCPRALASDAAASAYAEGAPALTPA
jgi:bacterioferritin-associated ferredoxin